MSKTCRLSFILCSLLLLTLMLVACNNTSKTANQGADQPMKLTFAGGQASGIWYMLTNGITESITKTYPGSVVTVVPGSGIANLIKINNNQSDLCTSHSVVAVDALNGYAPFEEKLDNIAAVASFYPSYLQIMVDKELGITTFDELINNKMKIRISVDSLGSTAEVSFKRMLEEYGVTYDDLKAWGGEVVFREKAESTDMLGDGFINGFSTLTLYPSTTIQEVMLNKELVLLSINPDIIDRLSQKYGYGKGIVPANTYKNNSNDVTTFTSQTIIVMPKNAPEELAYKICRSIHLNLDYIKSIHVALKELTPEALTQDTGIPLHQGAQKYYEEAGIIKK